ncbi:aldo/keto reductase [Paenibacillus cremeus]|uniref:Aldo/keto reductase n=1 Tax=Paenibacillus cremeus TaxID=2163881 RepID=A0A559KA65_9BACL|nr:aldo/keto reductase [Paenibacillus cremeus]TVY08999.1 aldo/keto reductase [Paenibacillus cremeus]
MTTKPLALHKHGIQASRLVLGCMGLGGGANQNPLTADDFKKAHEAVEAALAVGINMFDHANIYAMGKAEQAFGQVLKERPELRDRIILQSKCGIRRVEGPGRPGRYDFSEAHILESVDGILSRLGVEALDILLLHRPDPLMEPEEVASAFGKLKQAGKVRSFGVSNMSPSQIRLLSSCLDEPLVANQLELNLAALDWVDASVLVNQKAGAQVNFPEGLLEYCRLEHIQVQSWSPLARGVFAGCNLDAQSESIRQAAALVQELARQKEVSTEAIVLAWLMRHPAGIQPVIGTTSPDRIRACAKAERITLSREEWYDLYVTSRGSKMP